MDFALVRGRLADSSRRKYWEGYCLVRLSNRGMDCVDLRIMTLEFLLESMYEFPNRYGNKIIVAFF